MKTVPEILSHIHSELVRNRVEFDLLQSLRDRITAASEPATPTPTAPTAEPVVAATHRGRKPQSGTIVAQIRSAIAGLGAKFTTKELCAQLPAVRPKLVSDTLIRFRKGHELMKLGYGEYGKTDKFNGGTAPNDKERAYRELRSTITAKVPEVELHRPERAS